LGSFETLLCSGGLALETNVLLAGLLHVALERVTGRDGRLVL
jgi:hypothetical protein